MARAIIVNDDCRRVTPILGDGSVDLIVTDPPYGINANVKGDWESVFRARGKVEYRTWRDARTIAGDSLEEANSLMVSQAREWKRLLSFGAWACCCCSGGGGLHAIQYADWSHILDREIGFNQMVVWDKGPLGIGLHWRRSYELVLTAKRPREAAKWYDDTHRIENIIRPGMHGIRKVATKAEGHPFPKPVALAEFFIRLMTKPGDTVLDPFCGAGWVGEAALRLGRKFIGIELDKHWADVATRRLENL